MPILPIGVDPEVFGLLGPILDSVGINSPGVNRVDDFQEAGRVVIEVGVELPLQPQNVWIGGQPIIGKRLYCISPALRELFSDAGVGVSYVHV